MKNNVKLLCTLQYGLQAYGPPAIAGCTCEEAFISSTGSHLNGRADDNGFLGPSHSHIHYQTKHGHRAFITLTQERAARYHRYS